MKFIKEFIKLESSAGIILGLAALLAIIIKNSPTYHIYDSLLAYPLNIGIGYLSITKTVLLWVNDFLMAIFFFLVGLELKRESFEGQLAIKENRNLPAFAALGGLICPSLIYAYINWGDNVAIKGWAVPAATDIAFALGVLSLLGKRIPASLKLCLLTLAIFDDIAAVLIIAIFYTSDISIIWLLFSLIPLSILAVFNKCSIKLQYLYLIAGLALWVCILKTGVHATIAGILLALFIPLKIENKSNYSPLKQIEHTIHPWVSFGILPLFAFFNAGISLKGISWDLLTRPITLGIIAGLFLGKQVGVMLFTIIGIKFKYCQLPQDVTWRQYYGMATLTGIGFTMSLFIGMLAFSNLEQQTEMQLSVIVGSLLSAVLGYLILKGIHSKPSLSRE